MPDVCRVTAIGMAIGQIQAVLDNLADLKDAFYLRQKVPRAA